MAELPAVGVRGRAGTPGGCGHAHRQEWDRPCSALVPATNRSVGSNEARDTAIPDEKYREVIEPGHGQEGVDLIAVERQRAALRVTQYDIFSGGPDLDAVGHERPDVEPGKLAKPFCEFIDRGCEARLCFSLCFGPMCRHA